MIDLGLSVKWAPFNIGAQGASETGDYICWGEITEKQYSHIYYYKWYQEDISPFVIADRFMVIILCHYLPP